MKHFNTKKAECFEFTLGDDEKVYAIPYVQYMPLSLTVKLSDVSRIKDEDEKAAAALHAELDITRVYMGDVVDTLTAEQLGEIFAAWNEESAASGAELGE